MKSNLEVDTWMGALKWTPETAESCVVDLCAYLKNEHRPTWHRLAPRIGAGLTCLAGSQDELYRLAVHVQEAAQDSTGHVLGKILAGVDAELPERYVFGAIRYGGTLAIMGNQNYSVMQRLAWLKDYAKYVLREGNMLLHMARVELPIKEALAIWCYMEAARGDLQPANWPAASLERSDVSKEFLRLHAPSVVDQIDIVQVLGLPYAAAVDMLIDAGNGEGVAPVLDLPELNGARLASQN
jgi:hypothetical protein